MSDQKPFKALNIAIMTVSDRRTEADDTSGDLLVSRVNDAGHHLAEKVIVKDDKYKIREIMSRWIADPEVHAVVTTGGTGLTGRDITPEAVEPLFDKKMDGFGEVFRQISFKFVGTSTMQSRATGGIANATAIFCLPGSTGACKDGWDGIIKFQLDINHTPCNLVELMPRFNEK